jgi:hypothetical protein
MSTQTERVAEAKQQIQVLKGKVKDARKLKTENFAGQLAEQHHSCPGLLNLTHITNRNQKHYQPASCQSKLQTSGEENVERTLSQNIRDSLVCFQGQRVNQCGSGWQANSLGYIVGSKEASSASQIGLGDDLCH